jgi:hypothetical protein
MKLFFISFLFLFGFSSFSKNTAPKKLRDIPQTKKAPSKNLVCTERGCNCDGPGCSFVDSRIIKNASTVAITCDANKNCGQKIVYQLNDKYGCKASAQKLEDQDYLIVSECLIMVIDGPDVCPRRTKAEYIEELIQICLEVPNSNTSRFFQKSKNKAKL